MSSSAYLLKRLFTLHYKKGFSTVRSVSKRTSRSMLSVAKDMWQCAKRYGAGYMDYDLFEMDRLSDAERDTYLTRGRNNALVRQYNDPAYTHCFDNKDEFVSLFREFLHRDSICINDCSREDLVRFITGHPEFYIKPTGGTCGRGIEKLRLKDYPNMDALTDYLQSKKDRYLAEEPIFQHPDVAGFYPDAINTVRVVSILKDDVVHIICAYFRIGNHHHYVDNFNSEGMVTPVNVKTGTITQKAIDKKKNIFAAHPETGKVFVGFTFPFWDEVLEMIDRAARVVPQMRYIGWDVAFTPVGPCLVEGNNFPGHDIYQLPAHTPDRIGMYGKFLV